MAQDNLLDRLLSKGTNTAINTPKAVSSTVKQSLYSPKSLTAPAQENKVAAVDQSIYRFRPVTNPNLVKSPLSTPLAKAAVKAPAYTPVQPIVTPGSTLTSTPTVPTVVTYLLTEVGDELMTEDNNNLIS